MDRPIQSTRQLVMARIDILLRDRAAMHYPRQVINDYAAVEQQFVDPAQHHPQVMGQPGPGVGGFAAGCCRIGCGYCSPRVRGDSMTLGPVSPFSSAPAPVTNLRHAVASQALLSARQHPVARFSRHPTTAYTAHWPGQFTINSLIVHQSGHMSSAVRRRWRSAISVMHCRARGVVGQQAVDARLVDGRRVSKLNAGPTGDRPSLTAPAPTADVQCRCRRRCTLKSE